jgi:hypothetical protein
MKSNRIAVYLDRCLVTQLCNQVSNNMLRPLSVLPRKRGEQAEVGRTRVFPLALRGKADLRIPAVYFPPAEGCTKGLQYTEQYTGINNGISGYIIPDQII